MQVVDIRRQLILQYLHAPELVSLVVLWINVKKIENHQPLCQCFKHFSNKWFSNVTCRIKLDNGMPIFCSNKITDCQRSSNLSVSLFPLHKYHIGGNFSRLQMIQISEICILVLFLVVRIFVVTVVVFKLVQPHFVIFDPPSKELVKNNKVENLSESFQ